VVLLSSSAAASAQRSGPGVYDYGASQGALTTIARNLAADFDGTGPIVACIHPRQVASHSPGDEDDPGSAQVADEIIDLVARLGAL
jgi:NAD(P)-dependent dehydrogenase (short-subunit alcohol dehydrogenase family)